MLWIPLLLELIWNLSLEMRNQWFVYLLDMRVITSHLSIPKRFFLAKKGLSSLMQAESGLK